MHDYLLLEEWNRQEEIWAGWDQPGRAHPEGDQLLCLGIPASEWDSGRKGSIPKKRKSLLKRTFKAGSSPVSPLQMGMREASSSVLHFHSAHGLAPFPSRIHYYQDFKAQFGCTLILLNSSWSFLGKGNAFNQFGSLKTFLWLQIPWPNL